MEPKTHITLLIDEEEATVINALLNLAHRDPMFLMAIIDNNKEEALNTLTKQATKKIHAANWCKDPNCSYTAKQPT